MARRPQVPTTPQPDQLSLDDLMDLGDDDLATLVAAGNRQASIEARFRRFHRDNPDVYRRLRAKALEARRAGIERTGIRRLWEALRWEVDLAVARGELDHGYKLNDHYPSRYSRLLMAQEEELEGMFETRELRTA